MKRYILIFRRFGDGLRHQTDNFIASSSEDWPSQWPAGPVVWHMSRKMSGAPGCVFVTGSFFNFSRKDMIEI